MAVGATADCVSPTGQDAAGQATTYEPANAVDGRDDDAAGIDRVWLPLGGTGVGDLVDVDMDESHRAPPSRTGM